jgi:hypothetical protein
VGIVVYILIDVASVVDGEAKVLKIVIFAMSGEKGSFKDSFMIF